MGSDRTGDGRTWAIVLAAGQGTRLSSLTTTSSGLVVPKQFCSLRGGPSLLQDALTRARAVVPSAYISAVVAQQHRRWWQLQLRALPDANIVVQPQNRGTALGILLALLQILARDPGAQIVLLPSDHHVGEEVKLARALRRAVDRLQWSPDEAVLLGFEPRLADPQLGYIIPGRSDGHEAFEVVGFVEKPAAAAARELIEHGALWNAFIIASTARALLGLFERCIPEIVTVMRQAVRHDLQTAGRIAAVEQLYDRLPNVDFSRAILSGQAAHLRVLPVPPCEWSDLGTPERVEETLRRVPLRDADPGSAVGMVELSLAAQYQRRGRPVSAKLR
jgi:mannose-1-phosphate guanylyltransferase